LFDTNPEKPYKYGMQKRKALRVRRAELDVSQIEVASAAGMGLDRFWRIENGVVNPSPAEEKAIARALKAKTSDLFPEQVSA
jgi:transcriptional regulator with XRE-family HTH domain